MSLKDDLTSCLQQETVILLLGSIPIFAAKEILTKIVNFKVTFSVAHALPHKFVLQFCLSNILIIILVKKVLPNLRLPPL